MNICFSIDYATQWGEELYICGSIPALGDGEEKEAIRMEYISTTRWQVTIDIPRGVPNITYYYLVKREGHVIRRERTLKHTLHIWQGYSFQVKDLWLDEPLQKHLYSSAFTAGFFEHIPFDLKEYPLKALVLKVKCPYVEKGQKNDCIRKF